MKSRPINHPWTPPRPPLPPRSMTTTEVVNMCLKMMAGGIIGILIGVGVLLLALPR